MKSSEILNENVLKLVATIAKKGKKYVDDLIKTLDDEGEEALKAKLKKDGVESGDDAVAAIRTAKKDDLVNVAADEAELQRLMYLKDQQRQARLKAQKQGDGPDKTQRDVKPPKEKDAPAVTRKSPTSGPRTGSTNWNAPTGGSKKKPTTGSSTGGGYSQGKMPAVVRKKPKPETKPDTKTDPKGSGQDNKRRKKKGDPRGWNRGGSPGAIPPSRFIRRSVYLHLALGALAWLFGDKLKPKGVMDPEEAQRIVDELTPDQQQVLNVTIQNIENSASDEQKEKINNAKTSAEQAQVIQDLTQDEEFKEKIDQAVTDTTTELEIDPVAISVTAEPEAPDVEQPDVARPELDDPLDAPTDAPKPSQIQQPKPREPKRPTAPKPGEVEFRPLKPEKPKTPSAQPPAEPEPRKPTKPDVKQPERPERGDPEAPDVISLDKPDQKPVVQKPGVRRPDVTPDEPDSPEEIAQRDREREEREKREAEAERKRQELEDKRREAEEKARKEAEAEEKRQAEIAKKRAELERRKQEAEDKAREQAEAEAEAKRQAEIEQRRKAEAEAEAKRAQDAREKRKELEAKRKELEAKKKAAEEAKKKAEQEKARREAEAEKRAELERRRAELERKKAELERKKAEAEARKREAEETARREAEAKAKQEEQARKRAELERRRAELERRKAELERQKRERESGKGGSGTTGELPQPGGGSTVEPGAQGGPSGPSRGGQGSGRGSQGSGTGQKPGGQGSGTGQKPGGQGSGGGPGGTGKGPAGPMDGESIEDWQRRREREGRLYRESKTFLSNLPNLYETYRNRLNENLSDAELDKYLTLIAGLESTWDSNARNPESSAEGLYQIIDSTFKTLQDRLPKGHPYKKVSKAQMLKNPKIQKHFGRMALRDNIKTLQNYNMPINSNTLYMAHHFGPQVAREIHANPDKSLEDIYNDLGKNYKEMIEQNPHIVNDNITTGSELINHHQNRALDMSDAYKKRGLDVASMYPADPADTPVDTVVPSKIKEPEVDQGWENIKQNASRVAGNVVGAIKDKINDLKKDATATDAGTDTAAIAGAGDTGELPDATEPRSPGAPPEIKGGPIVDKAKELGKKALDKARELNKSTEIVDKLKQKLQMQKDTSGQKSTPPAQSTTPSPVQSKWDAPKKPVDREKFREQRANEEAPPGDKYERMVKHIKKGYKKDGKLTKQEKGIAYATAWKHYNKKS